MAIVLSSLRSGASLCFASHPPSAVGLCTGVLSLSPPPRSSGSKIRSALEASFSKLVGVWNLYHPSQIEVEFWIDVCSMLLPKMVVTSLSVRVEIRSYMHVVFWLRFRYLLADCSWQHTNCRTLKTLKTLGRSFNFRHSASNNWSYMSIKMFLQLCFMLYQKPFQIASKTDTKTRGIHDPICSCRDRFRSHCWRLGRAPTLTRFIVGWQQRYHRTETNRLVL